MVSLRTSSAATTTYSNVVELKDVWVKYGDTYALEGVTLDVPKGDFLAIMGPNGAGKSTLLKTILGLAPLVRGSVRVFGKDPYKQRSEIAKKIGYVPQRENVNDEVPLRAIDVVMMGLIEGMRPQREEALMDKALKALEEVGLVDVAYKTYRELSGGQKQRVLIARAIVSKPELLLLDEPFSALDAQSSRTVARLLKKYNDEGTTIILVTHDITPIANDVKRVALLNKKLIAVGEPLKIFTKENLLKTYGVEVPVLVQGRLCIPLIGDQHGR
ncbi:metal ABC transporter ATP-binding protein [Ignicoccus hospitalis]|uniref:metal ABC transporter ATP-binding protein n=1 Tax=Ignicoccus hospitalis TaxID=160233 RepID=UPI00069892EC|nr:metal ABC transporter ATP-binding protein [Ignicoccus hospitalis]HIH90394.1 metal ABC transporter ATP-binding protein [Desulfurococcaceae archaeon]